MIRDRILQLEQSLERLFGGRPPREPLEIRRIVIDTLAGQIRPVGGGRRVLPFNRATVQVVAADAAERRVLKEALEPGALARDLAEAVDRAGGEVAGVELAVRFVRAAGSAWPPGARFLVTVSERGAADGGAETSADAARAVVLRVVEGDARPRTLTSEATRINIGRQVEVVDRSGKPVRRNDVAFVGDDEVSRSVSRAHAYIGREQGGGACRLFDENSAHGTQVERDGRWITVPAGRDGLKLRSGDTIRVGLGTLKFESVRR